VFADASLRPTAIFGHTDFPSEDEMSQFDLDIHAIVELVGTGRVAALNHLGTLRIFEPWVPKDESADVPHLYPSGRLDFVADLERVIALGDRLITSRPRAERLGGVLVTAPVASARDRLDSTTAQESFGLVSALSSCSSADGTGWVALGGEDRVRLVYADGGRVELVRWEVELDFLATVIVASGASLWVAGSASGGTGLDDYDWEQLKGGGLVELDLATGEVISSARFDHNLGWGAGGVPLVVADGVPYGVGRHGELYAPSGDGKITPRITPTRTMGSLGIAHAAVVGDHIVYGFNRGGYWLHAVPMTKLIERGNRSPRPRTP
jgi:hypothetical protein